MAITQASYYRKSSHATLKHEVGKIIPCTVIIVNPQFLLSEAYEFQRYGF